jgi:hypothetical protein
MKQIIDGKMFDTEIAKLVATNQYSQPGDFHYWREELYITRKGVWFIFGKGGPLTKYAISTGNKPKSGGSTIRPLNAKEAIEWLEKADKLDALEKYFASEIEDT